MPVNASRATDALHRIWRWMRADPKNLATVLTLPYTAFDIVDQVRWCRANGVSVWSRGATVEYVKARPLRVVLSIVVALLPEVVGAVAKRRRSSG